MASGQTQYYGLSQWEAADKVERVDFNSDNARGRTGRSTPWRSRRGEKPTNLR